MTTRAINVALLFALNVAAVRSVAAANPESAVFRFLEPRVQNDPLDAVAHNRLSAVCIHLMRETGDLVYLDRAMNCARASLAAVPPAQNPGGVAALALAEFESHHFRAALASAGDAQLELGNYAEAEQIYRQLGADESTPPICARLARLAELQGENQ